MAKLKEVEVSLGVSVEVNKTWYKLNAREVVEIDVTDTEASRKAIWNKMWNDVEGQIETQISQLRS
jgi:hypothetical protein